MDALLLDARVKPEHDSALFHASARGDALALPRPHPTLSPIFVGERGFLISKALLVAREPWSRLAADNRVHSLYRQPATFVNA